MNFQSLFDGSGLSLGNILISLLIGFILSLLLKWHFLKFGSTFSNRKEFGALFPILILTVTLVIAIVKSSLALSLGLVGALSIVRFRNAVKDSRDVGYIFFAMAIGMAAGTRFYMLAIVATFLICFILWGMSSLNMFAKDVREQILKIRLPADMDHERLFERVFNRYLTRYNLIAVETVQAGMLTELVYGVEFKDEDQAQAMMQDLSKLNDNNKVALITGHHEVDL